MAVNKVVVSGDTLIDLSSDTVSPGTLLLGETAHDKTGAIITGIFEGEFDIENPQSITIQGNQLIWVDGEGVEHSEIIDVASLKMKYEEYKILPYLNYTKTAEKITISGLNTTAIVNDNITELYIPDTIDGLPVELA